MMASVKKTVYKTDPQRWVETHGDYLYRFALLRVNDRLLAQDLVQDTFLSALKTKESFKGNSSERTWFTSILKRKIIDRYRKTSSQPELNSIDSSEDDFLEDGHWNPARAPRDWDALPDELVSQREFMHILKRCIRAIPNTLASVFTMKEIDGEKSTDICKELNISASNLWVMLHRARTHLRRCLEQNWFEKKTVAINE